MARAVDDSSSASTQQAENLVSLELVRCVGFRSERSCGSLAISYCWWLELFESIEEGFGVGTITWDRLSWIGGQKFQ
jgi:hypothetical protein